jgi:hypothetical protein
VLLFIVQLDGGYCCVAYLLGSLIVGASCIERFILAVHLPENAYHDGITRWHMGIQILFST